MAERAIPPPDIEPAAFFVVWVPNMVAADPERQEKLGDTEALLEFDLAGEGGGLFTVRLEQGVVSGQVGGSPTPDLKIQLERETWEDLNAGRLSAPDAFLRRKVKLQGNLKLALKLHLILG